ncbi:MAG TPA: biopolymer transporter ExbD [Kofleriaceae bacterium]
MAFTQREARRLIRKAVGRVPEGEEIRHLNIMPMMDMMTILLVAFIYQAAVSATQLLAGTVSLPRSLTADDLPENATTVVITKTGIVVASDKAKTIVPVSNGDVDAGEKEEGATGIKIPRLTAYLAALHHEEEAVRQRQPGFDPAHAPPPELLLIADRSTPYHLLIAVLYSAKQKEAGYQHFRLIVQKSFPNAPPRK